MSGTARLLGTALLAAVVFFGGWRAVRSAALYLSLPGEPPPGEAGEPTLPEWELLRNARERDRRITAASAIPPALDPFHLSAPEEESAAPPPPEETPAREEEPAREVTPAPPPVPEERETPVVAAAPSPATPEEETAEEYAIPAVARRAGAEGEIRVILDLGNGRSAPLAAGEEFRGWVVSGFSDGRVFLAHRGVTYALPLP